MKKEVNNHEPVKFYWATTQGNDFDLFFNMQQEIRKGKRTNWKEAEAQGLV